NGKKIARLGGSVPIPEWYPLPARPPPGPAPSGAGGENHYAEREGRVRRRGGAASLRGGLMRASLVRLGSRYPRAIKPAGLGRSTWRAAVQIAPKRLDRIDSPTASAGCEAPMPATPAIQPRFQRRESR